MILSGSRVPKCAQLGETEIGVLVTGAVGFKGCCVAKQLLHERKT